ILCFPEPERRKPKRTGAMPPKIKHKEIISVFLKGRGQREELSTIGFVTVTEKNKGCPANRWDEPPFQVLTIRRTEGERKKIPQQEAAGINGLFKSFRCNDPVRRKG